MNYSLIATSGGEESQEGCVYFFSPFGYRKIPEYSSEEKKHSMPMNVPAC